MSEAVIALIRAHCDYCGENFLYRPALIDPDMEIRWNVQRIGERCTSHEIRLSFRLGIGRTS